jgi:hypothetical protein
MISSLKVLRHRMEGEQFRNQEVISFDQPMEFANCPLSKTASRLLTVRGHRRVSGAPFNDKITMAGRVPM